MEFIIKYFNDLSASELYLILKLRNNVFVIEQNCIYEELDGIDKFCYHIFLFENEELFFIVQTPKLRSKL